MISGHLSGHLKETIMRVYDVRPSTADCMMEVLEIIDRATKNEYLRGWEDGQEELREEMWECSRDCID